jgi:hypothetical protein
MTTAPRLLTFEPEVTVQRARWSVGASAARSEVVVADIVVTSRPEPS